MLLPRKEGSLLRGARCSLSFRLKREKLGSSWGMRMSRYAPERLLFRSQPMLIVHRQTEVAGEGFDNLFSKEDGELQSTSDVTQYLNGIQGL